MRRAAAFTCLALAACGEPAASPGRWVLEATPLLAIGGVAGDSMLDFSRVVGAVRFSDGTLAVANGGTGELRWFDATGRPRALTRRSDSLPGMTLLFRQGDTLLVWDARSGRLGAWDATGSFLGARRVKLPDSSRSVGVRGLLADGALLVESPSPLVVPDSGRVVRNPGALFRVPLAGPAESLGTVLGDEFFVLREGERASVLRLPFGTVTQVIAGPWGYAVSESASGTIALYAPDGRATGSAPTPPRRPVTASDRERLRRVMLGSARTGREAEAVTRVWGLMTLPDSFPAVTGFVGDPAALGWVRQAAHLADSSATWHVLGTSGTELGRIQLPARATPLDIGTDQVVLHTLDADGIERVEVHRLVRGPTS